MGVLRLGYVHARVTDMDEAKQHYERTLGMKSQGDVDGKAYFKGWDEWDHHSLVLEEGGVGLVKLGYKVDKSTDIDDIEKKAQKFGAITERMSKGENHEVGDGIRIISPSDHVIEIYQEMTEVSNEVGFINPEVFPRELVGVGVPAVDHALITAEDPALAEKFFGEVLDFFPTERVQTSLEDDHQLAGTWMSASQKVHDIAIIGGPQAKLHHFAFQLDDWSKVGRAASLFSMDDVSVDIGPTQHGITRGTTVYFFDPCGNRNEVFAGGYHAYRDRPVVRWTVDQLGKGIFYVDRELNERFTTVLT
ncbi:catechol 2,3-dioxygenase [Propionibacteriaceae bacterium ES.041]|uniref:Metapyrocatechase n=1 Tax=Enemella evansiae TaxID=2016499 RepID=A0A255GLH9_9ACTN|nr:catechol 2,3-dioxygenase [Enemella evansiae]PFG65684.1 catechol 2,3-dioxygenase [Propionibacteriaceae bacterium ES.041]OYN98616.1 catechol 2,3-dioxygenase [Enemella evansiae]OYO02210.1 catechol 2,3-dioxygenase [Enemella evansiae]OYO10890.1 catechol 2,3-dioxygenase [Enemella evansiae]OYO16697.1 catechol 2,3-dioxygenase [Enemella evansiae]